MTVRSSDRTCLALLIRSRRLTVEEFHKRLEAFAAGDSQVTHLSLRHLQRIAAGELRPEQLCPATVRLLEGCLDQPVDELLAAPDHLPHDEPRVTARTPAADLATARRRGGFSQERFAVAVGVDATTVGRWERGIQVPRPGLRKRIATVLNISDEEVSAMLDKLWNEPMARRSLLSIPPAALGVSLSRDLAASIAAKDAGPLMHVQTTYAVDKAVASLVDTTTKRALTGWTQGHESATVRVNAAGILAKLPDQSASKHVVMVLENDEEVRLRYLAAVTMRVCGLSWEDAMRVTQQPGDIPSVSVAARRFSSEALNPADAGARWCSARMLGMLSPWIGRGQT